MSRFISAAALTMAVAVSAIPVTAQTQTRPGILENIENAARAYTVLILRSAIDFTYDTLTVDPRTGALIASGLTFYPILDWDEEVACEIRVAQAIIGSTAGVDDFNTLIEATEVKVASACLDPSARGFLAQHGYEDGLTADSATIDVSYFLPTASAKLSVQASIAEAVEISLSANFEYVALTGLLDGGEPDPDNLYPVANMESAEVTLTNLGAFERFEPTLNGMLGSLNVVPDMVAGQLTDMLSEGGDRRVSQAETDFVEALSSELARFIDEKNAITVTAAPSDGVWLTEDTFSSPNEMISQLQPTVGTNPASFASIIPPAKLASALTDGDDLSEGDRLTIGRALVTGIGAPQDLETGKRLLDPLAVKGDAEAALLIAQATMQGCCDIDAYAMALMAVAGGERAAMSMADALERRLSVSDILAIQEVAANAFVGKQALEDREAEILRDPAISDLRRMAQDAYLGRDMPRNYARAYYWVSIAAAAGDTSSASLRDRMNTRLGDDAAWRDAAAKAATAALQTWANDGLAEAFFDRYGIAR